MKIRNGMHSGDLVPVLAARASQSQSCRAFLVEGESSRSSAILSSPTFTRHRALEGVDELARTSVGESVAAIITL